MHYSFIGKLWLPFTDSNLLTPRVYSDVSVQGVKPIQIVRLQVTIVSYSVHVNLQKKMNKHNLPQKWGQYNLKYMYMYLVFTKPCKIPQSLTQHFVPV
jgi:hypothetical protein